MNWAINNTLEVCKGAIAPGVEYAESYLEAVWQAAKQSSRGIKEGAAERGKLRHTAIENAIKQAEDPSLGLNDPNEFLQRFRFSEIERRVYSRRFRFSGTLDAIAEDREFGTVLLDWKTSKSIYPEFRLQTAAYVAAYEEEFPDKKIEGRYLVRIAEDGTIEPHFFSRSTLKKDFQAFLGARALYERVQQIEKEMRHGKL